MSRPLRNIALTALFLVASGCGPQDAPKDKPPANVGGGPAPAAKTCTEPLKTCAGGAVPTVDPATCSQSCPGE